MLTHMTLGQTGRPTASPECHSRITHHPRAPEQRSSRSRPDMTLTIMTSGSCPTHGRQPPP